MGRLLEEERYELYLQTLVKNTTDYSALKYGTSGERDKHECFWRAAPWRVIKHGESNYCSSMKSGVLPRTTVEGECTTLKVIIWKSWNELRFYSMTGSIKLDWEIE